MEGQVTTNQADRQATTNDRQDTGQGTTRQDTTLDGSSTIGYQESHYSKSKNRSDKQISRQADK
jgi:hypothetical protein